MGSVAAEVSGDIQAIEEAFVAQWAHFGLGPDGVLHDEGDLIWIEAPIPQLPYNAVVLTRLGNDADDRIRQVVAHFRNRGAQLMWLAHPTARPGDLAQRLSAHGLSLIEHATGMSLQIASWKPASLPHDDEVTYLRVEDEKGMRAYEELIADYWELPEESRPYVFRVNRWAYELGNRGERWVAFRDGRPVGKAYLSYLGVADTSSIFGLYVKPTERGRGIASRLTEILIASARDRGFTRVVLHSTRTAVELYRRIGFQETCPFLAYGTARLHSVQQA